MPSTSKKQHDFMAAIAHSPSFAKKAGVPVSVGKEFIKADKESGMKGMKKMAMGGTSGRVMPAQSNVGGAARGLDRAAAMSGRTMPTTGMKKGGVTASKMGKVVAGGTRPHGEHTVQEKGHTRGKQVKMAGSTKGMKKGGKC